MEGFEGLIPWYVQVKEKAMEGLPVLLYGMGNGAEKIIRACQKWGIEIEEIFASDGFSRGQRFLGYLVRSYSEVLSEYANAVVIVAFGSAEQEVIERIAHLDHKYELFIPDVALFGEEKPIWEYGDRVSQVMTLFEVESRAIFANLVRYKISGRHQYLLEATSCKNEAYQLLGLHARECYVDAGAYDGDTIKEVLGMIGEGFLGEILAIEPDKKNFKKLQNYAQQSQLGCIELVNKAVSDKTGQASFQMKGGRCSALGDEKGEIVEVVSLDDLLEGRPVSLLKLDVEGAEKEALQGARKVLKQVKPRLIVSAYHRSGDLLDLPELILELNPEYRLSLRHHPYFPAWDTNIYAW